VQGYPCCRAGLGRSGRLDGERPAGWLDSSADPALRRSERRGGGLIPGLRCLPRMGPAGACSGPRRWATSARGEDPAGAGASASPGGKVSQTRGGKGVNGREVPGLPASRPAAVLVCFGGGHGHSSLGHETDMGWRSKRPVRLYPSDVRPGGCGGGLSAGVGSPEVPLSPLRGGF
jgi:hypothetical protein